LAEWEVVQASAFDHHVTNDDVDAASARIARILESGDGR
jgi:guanylate kinase